MKEYKELSMKDLRRYYRPMYDSRWRGLWMCLSYTLLSCNNTLGGLSQGNEA